MDQKSTPWILIVYQKYLMLPYMYVRMQTKFFTKIQFWTIQHLQGLPVVLLLNIIVATNTVCMCAVILRIAYYLQYIV